MWEEHKAVFKLPVRQWINRAHQKEDSCSQATIHHTRRKILKQILSSTHLNPVPLKHTCTHKQRGSRHGNNTFSNCFRALTLNLPTRKKNHITKERRPCDNPIDDRPKSDVVTWKRIILKNIQIESTVATHHSRQEQVHAHPANKKEQSMLVQLTLTVDALHKCEPRTQ